MTIATKTEPRKTARQDSHHVRPSATKEATVAQEAGYMRSETQSVVLGGHTISFGGGPLSPESIRRSSHPNVNNAQVKKVMPVQVRWAGGDGSMSTCQRRVAPPKTCPRWTRHCRARCTTPALAGPRKISSWPGCWEGTGWRVRYGERVSDAAQLVVLRDSRRWSESETISSRERAIAR